MYVYLRSKHNEFFVDEATFEEIAEIVRRKKLCTYDYHEKHFYTDANPCVGQQMCLAHFLAKHTDLQHLSSMQSMTEDGEVIHSFMDKEGWISTSTEDVSQDPSRDMLKTLSYYGYSYPTSVEWRGKTTSFSSSYARLHGDFHTACVLVMSYHSTSDKTSGLFLLSKHGGVESITKRSELYQKAEQLVEATKDSPGEYHVNGYSHFGKYESDVYEVMSKLASASYAIELQMRESNRENSHRGGK